MTDTDALRGNHTEMFRREADEAAGELQVWCEKLAQLASERPDQVAAELEQAHAMFVAAAKSEVYEHFHKRFAGGATAAQLVQEAQVKLTEAASGLGSGSRTAGNDFMRRLRTATLSRVVVLLKGLG